MKRKEPSWLSPVVIVIAVAILALGLMWADAEGANAKLKVREYFDGSTADTVRYDLWADGDSIKTGNWTAVDSIRDSITIDPTLGHVIRFKGYFFGLSDVLCWEKSYPAREPVISDTNIAGEEIAMMPEDWTAADSAAYQGAGGAGSGKYTVNLLFADTSGGGTAGVPYVQAGLRGWNTPTLLGTGETNESGIATFGTDADSVAFKGVGPTAEYIWPVLWEDSVAGSGDLTDTVMGYKIDIPVSSGSQVCAVTVIVLDNAGEAAHNVRVSAYLLRSNLRDSAGYAVANYLQEKKTDNLGRATFQCRWSSYLIPATKWLFTVKSPAVGQTKKKITVPRQTSYTLEF